MIQSASRTTQDHVRSGVKRGMKRAFYMQNCLSGYDQFSNELSHLSTILPNIFDTKAEIGGDYHRCVLYGIKNTYRLFRLCGVK